MSIKKDCEYCGLSQRDDVFCEHCGRLIGKANSKADHTKVKGLKFYPKTKTYRLTSSWIEWWTLGLLLLMGILIYWLTEDAIRVWQIEHRIFSWYAAIAAILVYFFLAAALNRTKIVFTSEFIKVNRGPFWLPLVDSFHLTPQQIYSINMHRETFRGKRGTSITYVVRLINTDRDELYVYDFGKHASSAEALSLLLNSLFPESKRGKLEPLAEMTDRPKDFNEAEAWRVHSFYMWFLPSSLTLNIPALRFIKEWRWDLGYFALFLLYTLAWFFLMYFHHRKYLNFLDSRPRRKKEHVYGPIAYLIMSLIWAAMQCTVPMWIYQIFLK
jgi:hypothetical protein